MAEPHGRQSIEVVVARNNKVRSAKQDAKSVEVQERRDKALALRRAGATYAQIGMELGCERQVANRLFHEALAAIPKENAEAVLKLELERLDRDLRRCEGVLDNLETKAKSGNIQAAGALAAILNSVRRIQERRAKYLGLDAPTKTEVTGKDGTPLIDMEARVVLFAKLDGIAARLAPEAGAGGEALNPKPG